MMDGTRFEDLLRLLTGSRRSLLGGALATVTGLLVVPHVDAKKKRKKHKKRRPKATPNEFGCLEVGDPCQSEEQCCSGICDGKKGKRKCRAHDIGTCEQARPGYCAEGNPNDASCNGGKGACFRTTAGSNVCINNFECAVCQRDDDCEALGFPPGSACAPVGGDLACAELCEETVTACVYFGSVTMIEIPR